jgi:signal transduction histidine kinase/CheY-like chemotaxis protein
MRLLPGAAAVCLLLALLTFFLVKGAETGAADYGGTLRIFDDFALAEATLHRDVLEARAGLLTDYDPLVGSIKEMDAAVAELRVRALEEGLEAAPVDRLAAAVATEEELTERFKSADALLRNSLSYVSLLSTSPDLIDHNSQLSPSVGALAAAILHLTLDSSQQSRQAVQDRLAEVASQAPSAEPDASGAQALVAHGRLLESLLPTVDETLKALLAVPSAQSLEETRAMFSDRHASLDSSAQRFRLLLYGTSLLLVAALIDLGRRLRARAVRLRQRAAFEHLIAENSTRLINCPPGEAAPRLKQALAELGVAIGADRAYVVLAKRPIRTFSWSVDEAPFPPGWPEASLALPEQLKNVGHDIVTVPDAARLPAGDAKKTLMTFGVRAWAGVSLLRPGCSPGILGFDRLKPARGLFFPLAVVRLAGDAIGSAIERDALERERSRLAARLERALRLQMIGQLASGIAHNFNNIIGAILGYSEMASTEVSAGSKPAQHIDEIQRAAERGRDLVDSILTFGRRSESRSRLISVPALLEETASLLRASLPPGVELAIGDAPSDLALFGESAQLQQIILNLCRNASQAMEGVGRISVTADAQDLASPRAFSHGEVAPGRYMRLVVNDTGPGFDQKVARRLFEPFFTTRPGGTGLGLATVGKIVRDHEGAMHVASAPGRGSRFEVWLPAAAGAGSPAPAGESAPSPLGRGETVLLVQNERARLPSDEEMLAALGYEPVGYEGSADAIAALRANSARFDAILISQTSAPAALNLAQAMHEIAPRLPILLATRSAVDVRLDALVEAGIADIVRRPLTSEELAVALSRSLRTPAPSQT